MIRRLLVVIDSAGSETAIRYAMALASQHQAGIHVLGLIDTDAITRAASGAGPGASHYARELREHLLDEAQQATRATLDATAKRIEEAELPVKTTLETGVVRSIVQRHSLRADLLVVPRDLNLRFPDDDRPGRELAQVLRLHVRPVLVVPKDYREIKTVIVAHDMTLECARNLFMLLQLRPFPMSKMIVLYADPEGRSSEEGFWLDGLGYLQAHGLDAEIIVRNLEPAASILEVVDERKADCVVLGPYSSGAIRDFLFGGTSHELLERGNVPLLFGF